MASDNRDKASIEDEFTQAAGTPGGAHRGRKSLGVRLRPYLIVLVIAICLALLLWAWLSGAIGAPVPPPPLNPRPLPSLNRRRSPRIRKRPKRRKRQGVRRPHPPPSHPAPPRIRARPPAQPFARIRRSSSTMAGSPLGWLARTGTSLPRQASPMSLRTIRMTAEPSLSRRPFGTVAKRIRRRLRKSPRPWESPMSRRLQGSRLPSSQS